MKAKLLLVAACFVSVGAVRATDRTWTGGGDGESFLDMSNWNPSDAFADGDTFTLPSAKTVTYNPPNQWTWYKIGGLTGPASTVFDYNLGYLKLIDASGFLGPIVMSGTGSRALCFVNSSDVPVSTINVLSNGTCFAEVTVDSSAKASIDKVQGNGSYFLSSNGTYHFGDMSEADSRIYNHESVLSLGTSTFKDVILNPYARWETIEGKSAYVQTADVTVPSGTADVRFVYAMEGAPGFVKKGDGTLIVDAMLPTNLPVTVRAGALRFKRSIVPAADPQPAANAYLQLDADADGALEFTEGKISAWKDLRPGATITATEDLTWEVYNVGGNWTSTMTRQRPFVAAETWNGHKVVDFGTSAAQALNRAITDGASLLLTSDTQDNVREGFLVLSEERVEGMPEATSSSAFNYNPRWFGTATWHENPCNRGDYPYLILRASSANAHSDYDIDGLPVSPCVGANRSKIGVVPEGVHVIHFHFKRKMLIQTLFRESGIHVGGGKLGEVIFYDRELTAQERVDTEAYLMKKWLGKDHPLARAVDVLPSIAFSDGVDPVVASDAPMTVNSVTGSGDFTKGGTGVVTAKLVSAQNSYAVEGGALVASVPTLESEAYLHVDATRLDTMTWVDAGGGVTNVTKWADANGGAHWAQSYKDANVFPTLTTNSDGKSALDFGAWVKGDNSKQCDAAFMHFDAACTATKDVFVVWEFAPGVSTNSAPILGTWPDQYGGAWQIHWTRSNYLGYFGGHQYSANPMIQNSSFWMDGEFQESEYMWKHKIAESELGPHVLNISVTNLDALANLNLSTIASDRNYNWGGVKVSELLVFDKELTDAQRQYLRAKLTKKWKGTEVADAGSPLVTEAMTVANGAVLELSQKNYLVPVVGGEGTIDAGDLAGVTNLVLDGNVAVKGGIAFADGAVIDVKAIASERTLAQATATNAVTFAGQVTVRVADLLMTDKLASGACPLVTCPEGCGLTKADLDANWTLDVGENPRGYGFKLGVDALGNPCVVVMKRGFMLIVR